MKIKAKESTKLCKYSLFYFQTISGAQRRGGIPATVFFVFLANWILSFRYWNP